MALPLHHAVHVDASGADAHSTERGDTRVAVVHSGSAPVHDLSAGRLHLPGGHATTVQVHHTTETVLVIVNGYSTVLSGHNMEALLPKPGEMVYVPPGIAYAVGNLSRNASVLALMLRFEPGFSTDIHPVTDLDELAESRVRALRIQHLERIIKRRTGQARRAR